jgi:hypothetical protein
LLTHTAHVFVQQLIAEMKASLYELKALHKKPELWQRESLCFAIYSRAVVKQTLDYIHFNPVSGNWQLSKDDLSYYYSSARFYETGRDEFGFLNNIYEVFDGV